MSACFGETCRLVYNIMYDFLLYAYVGVGELLLAKWAESKLVKVCAVFLQSTAEQCDIHTLTRASPANFDTN